MLYSRLPAQLERGLPVVAGFDGSDLQPVISVRTTPPVMMEEILMKVRLLMCLKVMKTLRLHWTK